MSTHSSCKRRQQAGRTGLEAEEITPFLRNGSESTQSSMESIGSSSSNFELYDEQNGNNIDEQSTCSAGMKDDEHDQAIERQKMWGLLSATTAVAMLSAIDASLHFDYDDFYSANEDWAEGGSDEISTSFGQFLTLGLLTAILVLSIAICACLYLGKCKNSYYSIACVSQFLMWTSCCIVLFHSRDSLALDSFGYVRCANLFFFSWMSLGISCFILVLCFDPHYIIISALNQRILHWLALALFLSVILVSSVQIMSEDCVHGVAHGDDSEKRYEFFWETDYLCRRTRYGAFIGAIGMALSLFVIYYKGLFADVSPTSPSLPTIGETNGENVGALNFEYNAATILALLIGVGGAVITSSRGPGKSFGNLFFFSWFSFMLSLAIWFECFLAKRCTVSVSSKGVSNLQAKGTNNPSPRFTKWALLSVFGLIEFCSAIDAAISYGQHESEGEDYHLTRSQLYTTIYPALVSIVASGIFACHFYPHASDVIINSKAEGAAIALVFFLCIVGMTSINHSEKSLAVNGKGEVLCTNMYMFAWASFITTLKLLISYSGYHDHGDDVSPRTMRKIVWFMILKVTLVVWGGADHVRIGIEDLCEGDLSEEYRACERTDSAIVLSKIILITSIIGLIGNYCRWKVEYVFIYVVLFAAFSVYVVTTSDGPGATIGNLYLFTWLNFACAVALLTYFIKSYQAGDDSLPCNKNRTNEDRIYKIEMTPPMQFSE
eukprot:CAMPEP_0196817032 /NCGR_PEP_ID=MMETSP1362-20130617/58408_1 /TAXON_ID=163516 /ORGANISM="Leptocylindrus danicus, Strain CCMP1856" /LENGTH=718 /DNA_ID=CAMNT_0042194565 /DNA_START=1 /DNA_END=2157 /DNA_ORIENTATION=+